MRARGFSPGRQRGHELRDSVTQAHESCAGTRRGDSQVNTNPPRRGDPGAAVCLGERNHGWTWRSADGNEQWAKGRDGRRAEISSSRREGRVNVAALFTSMKRLSFSCGVLLAACVLTGGLRAADGPGTPAALAAVKRNGYTVTTEIKVNEKGEKESIGLIDSDDQSAGEVITKMALAMALEMQVPVREKNGKPVAYTLRAPFFFPIEDDEGPESEALPKVRPIIESAVMPAYPAHLRDEGVAGGAILELVTDEQGNLARLTVMRASHPEFGDAAKEAVEQWKFNPAQRDGRPVTARSRLAIVFETQDEMADLKWRVPPRPKLGAFVVIRPSEPIAEVEEGAEGAGEAAPAEAEQK